MGVRHRLQWPHSRVSSKGDLGKGTNVNDQVGYRPLLHSPLATFLLASLALFAACAPPASGQALRLAAVSGSAGGRLNASLRSEPKTLNPVYAMDMSSRAVTSIMHSDLLHINRKTDAVEPSLAKSWQVSRGGQTYTLHLRQGIRFSDGAPFTADDVLFSFQVYLDPELNAPQRDLLIIDGHPIQVARIDQYTVRFDLPRPYAAASRLFDGLAILPRHVLEPMVKSKALINAWTIGTPPAQLAGLGPFRLKAYHPGQSLIFERNPYYWKQDSAGRSLPYLDEVDFTVLPNQDAESIRFAARQLDLLARLSADSYTSLEKLSTAQNIRMMDGGPGLEFDLLLFNLNADVATRLPDAARSQKWFAQQAFRQALSLAINREQLVHLVFENHAVPLASPVTPASRDWADPKLRPQKQDLARARTLLTSGGFHWQDGSLFDREGNRVRFTIIASASNRQQGEIATLLQRDFRALGIDSQVVSLEFRSFLQRITQSHDFDIAVMGLSAGDSDPNGIMGLWSTDGALHLWNLGEKQSVSAWQSEIDSLMRRQLYLTDKKKRQQMYYRVQAIYAAELPFLSLASPNMLGAVRGGLMGVAPSALDPGMLDNIASYYWKK